MNFFGIEPTISGYLRKRRRTLHEACSKWSARKGLTSTPCEGCLVRDYCEATRALPSPLKDFATLRSHGVLPFPDPDQARRTR